MKDRVGIATGSAYNSRFLAADTRKRLRYCYGPTAVEFIVQVRHI